MGKLLKKLLIEMTLFISMAALAGHVTVNFWERYVVQDKLADIKSSLDHLKVTVYNMGHAYDELQHDLKDLARTNTKSFMPRETSKEESCKRRRELDDKILNRLDILLTRANDKPRHVRIVDKNTGSQVSTKAQGKNATTITRNPVIATAVGSEHVSTNNFKAGHNDINECIYNCILRNSARRCYEDCESRNKFQKF